MFSFSLDNFKRKRRKSLSFKAVEKTTNILKLKKQLIDLGYTSSEVDSLIMLHTDSRKIDAQTARKIEKALEKQLAYASGCLVMLDFVNT